MARSIFYIGIFAMLGALVAPAAAVVSGFGTAYTGESFHPVLINGCGGSWSATLGLGCTPGADSDRTGYNSIPKRRTWCSYALYKIDYNILIYLRIEPGPIGHHISLQSFVTLARSEAARFLSSGPQFGQLRPFRLTPHTI